MGTAHYLKIIKLQPEHSAIVFLESEKGMKTKINGCLAK